MRFRTWLAVIVLMLAACTSCSGGDESAEEAATGSTSAAAIAVADAERPPVELPGPGEPWDLLFIRNEIYLSAHVPQMYAELASEALGVEVRVHDAGGQDPRWAWQVLSQMQDISYPPLGDLVRDSEIIVVQGDPEQSGPNRAKTAIDHEFDNCFATGVIEPRPPELLTEPEWKPYRDHLDAIYDEIWSLREGTPTVLIAIDLHNPAIAYFQRERGLDAACAALWASWSDVIRKAAEDNGATMVSILELLTGPDGMLDPEELGYTGGPTLHHATTNEVGALMVAEALAAAGFEPSTQP